MIGLGLVLAVSLGGRAAEPPDPAFAIRGTLPWHNFLSGPSAWNEKDYAAYFARLEQLGLNFVGFHCYTGGAERYAPYVEPMIRIEYRNVLPLASLDTSLTARWGYRPLAIKDFAFGTSKLFSPPPGAQAFGADCVVTARTNAEHYEQTQALMRKVVDLAHAHGVQVAIGFEFGVHPPEFASVVPRDSFIRGAMLPDPTHPAAIEILRRTIDDILRAYPTIDWVWLWLHEHTMFISESKLAGRFADVFARDAKLFADAGNDATTFTGVWSLVYIRLARAYLAERAPKVRLAVGGWGGGDQLPGILRGLDRALPKDVVLTCLSPGQGTAPPLPVLGEIAKHRPVWAIPWLEGDARLWHLQPRVSLLRDHVRQARDQRMNGVVAIHWRTEEIRPNFDAFARFARDPERAPTVEAFYADDCKRQFGPEAAAVLGPLLSRMDRERTLEPPGRGDLMQSPEYFPYKPAWGRLTPELRDQLLQMIDTAKQLSAATGDHKHRDNLDWLAANLRFTCLLDEVGRKIEPAYQLRDRWLLGEIKPDALMAEVRQARRQLDAAPIETLFHIYAKRVRSRGELGVLSSLNQKLWLQYKELDRFLTKRAATTETRP